MPIKLIPPRAGKTPNYQVRGTYLGIYVERTTGTSEKRLAQQVLNRVKKSIERGDYAATPAVEVPQAPTFADAALAYLRAGGDNKYLGKIIELTGEHAIRDKLLTEIDQIAIDNAANALYPGAPATTTNRQFYTPVSAVLKRAGIEREIKRPKGWRGSKATSWLEPAEAFAVIDEAYAIEPEFGLFCLVLLYTGMRLSDPIKAKLRDLKIDRALLYIPDTKSGEPRPVHLPPVLVKAFRDQPARPKRPGRASGAVLVNGAAGRSRQGTGVPFLGRNPDDKLFRFTVSGYLRDLLALAIKRAGLTFPRRQGGFHLFCHTYGTWMKRYGKLDTYGLTRTGRWKDPASADRYNHTEASAEAQMADHLPVSTQNPGNSRGIKPTKQKSA